MITKGVVLKKIFLMLLSVMLFGPFCFAAEQPFERISLKSHNWEAYGSNATIEKDGSYKVEFGSPGIMQIKEGKLTSENLVKLIELINNAEVFSLNDQYSGTKETSRSWEQYNLVIETSAGLKSVNFHSEDKTAPQALHDLVNKIDEFTD